MNHQRTEFPVFWNHDYEKFIGLIRLHENVINLLEATAPELILFYQYDKDNGILSFSIAPVLEGEGVELDV